MLEVKPVRTINARLDSLADDARCLFGVSVGDVAAPLEEIAAGWKWTAARFSNAAVLLGDSLQRLSLQITEGLSPEAAALEAQHRGDVILKRITMCLAPPPNVIRTSELAREDRFDKAHVRFGAAFERDPGFHAIIEGDAARFCARQQRRDRLRIPFEAAMAISCRYLLEEVAIYEILAEQDWLIEAYVGAELDVLASFMKSAFPGLSPALERRVHISLKLHCAKEV